LPSGFTTNQAWMRDDSYQPEGLQVAPGYPKTFYGGKAGDDGRLDAWIDVAKTESMSVAIEVTREVSVGGQPGYLWSSSSGENRAFLRAEARSDDLIEAQSVGVAEADIIDALASLRCDGDLVYLDPPPGASELCHTGQQQWQAIARHADGSDIWLQGYSTDCPLRAMTGEVDGVESIETINGNSTVLYSGGWYGGAYFRDGDTMVIVNVTLAASDNASDVLRSTVEGLHRVNAREWHAANLEGQTTGDTKDG
jgi:hypothetical protein